ncbi:MAG: hypothetical protein ACM3SU_09580 [Acidobacteriota bacterium]
MNRRALAAALCLAAAGPLGCGERGRPDPDVRMAVSHERVEAEQQQSAQGSPEGQAPAGMEAQGQGQKQVPSVPTRLDVPDAVKKAYSGVVLLWKDSASGKEGKLEVPFGGSVALPDSGLTISADVYLPSFAMTAEVITSSGVEEGNPAARIRVRDKEKDIFSGWIFKRFPDVHPFTHPRFSLRLDGGIRSSAK